MSGCTHYFEPHLVIIRHKNINDTLHVLAIALRDEADNIFKNNPSRPQVNANFAEDIGTVPLKVNIISSVSSKI